MYLVLSTELPPTEHDTYSEVFSMLGGEEAAAVRRGPGAGRGEGRHRGDQDHGARGGAQSCGQQPQVPGGKYTIAPGDSNNLESLEASIL